MGRVRGNRPSRARFPTKARTAQENDELEDVPGRRPGYDLPHQPERRLSPTDGPDRSVKISSLVPFAFRRRLHARQLPERPEDPDGAGNREIGVPVNLLEIPMARRDRHDETDDIQQRERDDLTPGKRVADAPVERVGPILGEADDVRLRFDARERPAQAGDGRADQHRAQPQRHARVEAPFEQIEGERTRRDKKHENPDRPVIEPVIELVVFADLAVRVVFDRESVHGSFLRVLRRLDAAVLVRDVGGRLAFNPRV